MADVLDSEKVLSDFVNNLRTCLIEKNLTAALKLISDNKDKQEIQEKISDVLPLVVVHINEDIRKTKPKLFSFSEKVLNAIADCFDAEGMLLQLTLDVENACDDTAFLTLLQPLQKVLLRSSKKRPDHLVWGLCAIQTYLKQIPTPENLNLEEEEEILMDANPDVERSSALYTPLLPFYDVLIKDLYTEEIMINERKIIVLKSLLRLLEGPLAFLNLKCNDKTKSRGRRVSENIIEKIFHFTRDIFWIQELQTEYSLYDLDVGNLSMATFFYLVTSEDVLWEKVPKVYNPVYVFQCSLCLVTELFKHDNQFVVYNGLQLLQFLLDNVRNISLSYQLLDCEQHSKFCTALANIIIYNGLESHRKRALGLFRQYLLNFEMHGRYLLIFNLIKVLNHTGMIAYLITLFKDIVKDELDSKDGLSVYVSGPKLFVLLDMFCYLHKGEESDMVELADQLVASLNLLRYLAIRDKANLTKVWDHFATLEKSYFEPLKKGVILSRAHYKLKIDELKIESGKGDKSNVDVTLTVAGEDLKELPTSEKLKVLNSSLTLFDVIESLLSRLSELISVGMQNTN